jgi:hypothetical protein
LKSPSLREVVILNAVKDPCICRCLFSPLLVFVVACLRRCLFRRRSSTLFLPQHRSLLEVVILNAVKDPRISSLPVSFCCSTGKLVDRTSKVSPRNKKGNRKKRPPFPQLKNKLKSLSQFSSPKKRQSANHVYHATHHNFTTKTPRLTTHFLQKPLQKRQPHHNQLFSTNSLRKSGN